MTITTSKTLTDTQASRFFHEPQSVTHRQYEALRAYYADKVPSREVAQRFRYSPGAFRVLCHRFRHDPAQRVVFFPPTPRGPQQRPTRDRVRERVIALRKRNFSVYDIQRELAADGHAV